MKSRSVTILPAAVALFAALSPTGLFAGVGEWTSSGPDGGSIEALSVHPNNPSTVYASSVGILYKSVDSGGTWAATGLRRSTSLIVPTSDPNIVYVTATGFFTDSETVHRTIDGGETWVQRAGPAGSINALARDDSDPMTVYVGSSGGIFRSGNGGDSWETLPSPVTGIVVAVKAVAVDPTDSRVIYAGVEVGGGGGGVAGVYRSSDRGATWTHTNLREGVRSIHVDVDEFSRKTVFAVTVGNGLQVSTDGGVSWVRRAAGTEISHLAVSPGAPDFLYLIVSDVVYQSSDGGLTVTPVINGNFGQGVRGIVSLTFGTVLVGSERGISRSDDGGQGWFKTNRGIRGLFVQSLAVDPTDPAIVFAAAPGGIRTSRDGGESWEDPVLGSPEAEVVAIDPSNLSTLYAAGPGGVHKSDNGGQSWVSKSPPPGPFTSRIAELVLDPNNARRILAGFEHVYRSVDGAENWSNVLTPDDDYSSYYYPARVNSIAVAPSDSSIVYAGGDTGFIYRSDDGGEHWSDLRAGIGTFALVVDSCDPRIVQTGLYGAVYRTIDGGATWTANSVSENLPNQNPVWALARDPRHSSTFFAGTGAGLFWTNDRGVSWKRFEPRLDESVRSLALDSTGRFLYAGTERGVFQLERDFTACGKGSDRLCLMGAKYQVSLTARDRSGATIIGRAIDEGDSFGYFSLPDVTGDPTFPEVFVKMADARLAPAPYGGSAWVFHSSLTDLDYTLTVVETDTGRVQKYEAADARPLTCGEADTSAFDRDCRAAVPVSSLESTPAGSRSGAGGDLSFLGGRFRATLQARDPRTGRIAAGAAIPRGDRFGYFSLPDFTGDPTYPEIFVKMADATSLPGSSFWLFHTGLTDLDYTLTVTDQTTGAVKTYGGGATEGTLLCGGADTRAFRD